MRVYGRRPLPPNLDPAAPKWQWIEIDTDASGSNDAVNITWLVQCLKLQINESPFWGNWGIPARQSVMTQTAPDYYVTLMQQRFAPLFASLIITKNPPAAATRDSRPTPTYTVNLLTHQGVRVGPIAV